MNDIQQQVLDLFSQVAAIKNSDELLFLQSIGGTNGGTKTPAKITLELLRKYLTITTGSGGSGGGSSVSPEVVDEIIAMIEQTVVNERTRNSGLFAPIGAGMVFLSPTKTFAQQVTKANTIYVIQDDFNLGGASVTIPTGCTLWFVGGTTTNGTLVGQNTGIVAAPVLIFKGGSVEIGGTWNNAVSYSQWFAFNETDDSDNMQYLLDFRGRIELEAGRTFVLKTVRWENEDTGAGNYVGINDYILQAFSDTSIIGNGATLKLADGVLTSVRAKYQDVWANANMFYGGANISNFSMEDVTIDGNSAHNNFINATYGASRLNKVARFFSFQEGGKNLRWERCKFLNCAGFNCIALRYLDESQNRENAVIRDCLFKNGGAYISDGTLNYCQSDFSFVYSDFDRTVVDNCQFIQCDLDYEGSVNGKTYTQRKAYLYANVNAWTDIYENSPKILVPTNNYDTDKTDASKVVVVSRLLNPETDTSYFQNGVPKYFYPNGAAPFQLYTGGVEIHGNQTVCSNSLFIGCRPAIYITKAEMYEKNANGSFNYERPVFKPNVDINISDNIMRDCYNAIIFYHLEASEYRNISIRNNTIESVCGDYQIGSENVGHALPIKGLDISGNTLIAPHGSGMRFNALTEDCRITDNIIRCNWTAIRTESRYLQRRLVIANNDITIERAGSAGAPNYGVFINLLSNAGLEDGTINGNKINFLTEGYTIAIGGLNAIGVWTWYVSIFGNSVVNGAMTDATLSNEELQRVGITLKQEVETKDRNAPGKPLVYSDWRMLSMEYHAKGNNVSDEIDNPFTSGVTRGMVTQDTRGGIDSISLKLTAPDKADYPLFDNSTDKNITSGTFEIPSGYTKLVVSSDSSVEYVTFSLYEKVGNWQEADGAPSGIRRSGNYDERPDPNTVRNMYDGFRYYCFDYGVEMVWCRRGWFFTGIPKLAGLPVGAPDGFHRDTIILNKNDNKYYRLTPTGWISVPPSE